MNQLEKLQEQLKEKKKLKTSIKKELKKKETKTNLNNLEKLESQISNLNSKIKDLKKPKKQVKKVVKKVEKKTNSKKTEEKMFDVETDVDNKLKVLFEFQEVINKLKSSIENNKKLEKGLELLEKENSILKNKLNVFEEKVGTKYKSMYVEIKKQYIELEETLKEKIQNELEINSENQSLTEKIEILERKENEKTIEVNTLKEEISKHLNKISELNVKIDELSLNSNKSIEEFKENYETKLKEQENKFEKQYEDLEKKYIDKLELVQNQVSSLSVEKKQIDDKILSDKITEENKEIDFYLWEEDLSLEKKNALIEVSKLLPKLDYKKSLFGNLTFKNPQDIALFIYNLKENVLINKYDVYKLYKVDSLDVKVKDKIISQIEEELSKFNVGMEKVDLPIINNFPEEEPLKKMENIDVEPYKDTSKIELNEQEFKEINGEEIFNIPQLKVNEEESLDLNQIDKEIEENIKEFEESKIDDELGLPYVDTTEEEINKDIDNFEKEKEMKEFEKIQKDL